MIIQQTQDQGYTVYKFQARGVQFDVLTQNGQQFDVYSNRLNHSGRGTLNCYDSLEHLATRSKTFANFAKLIN